MNKVAQTRCPVDANAASLSSEHQAPSVVSRTVLFTRSCMQTFYTVTDNFAPRNDFQAILATSALVIPSTHHTYAKELLRTCFYRPPEPKPVPWIKRATYQLLGRQPRFDPSKKIPIEAVHRMLILRYDGLGDYLITTPLLQWLHRVMPDVNIDVLTSQRNDLLATYDPTVNNHVPIYDRPQFHVSVLRAMESLRRRRYDVVISLVLNNMTRQAVLARLLAPAADYVTILNNRIPWLYGKFFHRQVPHEPWQRHWIETFISIGPSVFESPRQCEFMPEIWLPQLPQAEDSVTQFLGEHGLESDCPNIGDCGAGNNGTPYVVVNISASDEERSLAYEQARRLCQALRVHVPSQAIVLVSSPRHRACGEQLAAELGPPVYYFHRSFFEMVPLIKRCRMVLTPDTALVHIAAALQKPVVGLYHRPVTVCEWYPYRTRFAIVLSMNPQGIRAMPIEPILHATELLNSQNQ